MVSTSTRTVAGMLCSCGQRAVGRERRSRVLVANHFGNLTGVALSVGAGEACDLFKAANIFDDTEYSIRGRGLCQKTLGCLEDFLRQGVAPGGPRQCQRADHQ